MASGIGVLPSRYRRRSSERSDQAFAWLERAYEEHSSKLVDLKIDPDFDGIRSEPRFAHLIARIGLP